LRSSTIGRIFRVKQGYHFFDSFRVVSTDPLYHHLPHHHRPRRHHHPHPHRPRRLPHQGYCHALLSTVLSRYYCAVKFPHLAFNEVNLPSSSM